MPRSHNKDCFYKFMSCETAEAVLENSSLRWTKPSLFNDPFDHQVSFKHPYSKDEFSSALAIEMERLVYADEVNFIESTLLSNLIILLRQHKNEIQRSEILDAITRGCEETAELFQEFQDKLNHLTKNSLNQSRVLCVAENNENVVMWSHYADSHKGICIRLQCIDEVDNALLVAEPVTYTDTFPVFLELTEHIDHLTGESPINIGALLRQLAFVKHKDWSYENEWRLHRPHEHNEGDYNDWVEDKRVFGAIYFGCKIEPENVVSLTRLIELKYPNMEIYQAKVSQYGFKIEYEKLN